MDSVKNIALLYKAIGYIRMHQKEPDEPLQHAISNIERVIKELESIDDDK